MAAHPRPGRRINRNQMKLLGYYFNHRISPPTSAAALILAAALLAALWHPALWPWAGGAVVASQGFLTIAGLWPRSQVLGPNWVTLPPAAAARREIALTIDDGPDPLVTPQVLALLDRHDAKATFFCVGERILRHPELCREIVRRGHAIENHTQHHSPLFAFFGPFRARRELLAAQQTLRDLAGSPALFFRPPAGIRSPILHPVLVDLGLQHASWTRRGFDTRQADPKRVLEKLLRGLKAGDILLLHDGNAARTASGTPVILEVLPKLLDEIAQAGLRPVTLRAARA